MFPYTCMGLLDLLFPKYCVSCKTLGSYLCADCFAKISLSQKTMCLVCGKGAMDGLTHPNCLTKESIDGCFICYEYKGVIKKLLYSFKYNPYVSDVQKLLSELFYEAIIQKEPLIKRRQDGVLTPIPLHAKKLKSRGYNHAQILAKNLAKQCNIPYENYILRTKETTIQFRLSKEKRKENMKNAFSLQKEVEVKEKTIFLIDDIVTTGSTFLEAAKILKKAGAKRVYGVAFSGEN